MADYSQTWSSEEDLHSTWDAVKREFPENFELLLQKELQAMEKDLRPALPSWLNELLDTVEWKGGPYGAPFIEA